MFIIDLSPSTLFLNDESLPELIFNDVDSNLNISQNENLLNNDRIVNPDLEDTVFDNYDELNSFGQISGNAEIASNSCVSNFSSSRKFRKRANANECSSFDFRISTPKLFLFDIDDLLQKAQTRRFCSTAEIVETEFTLMCAYAEWQADENTF